MVGTGRRAPLLGCLGVVLGVVALSACSWSRLDESSLATTTTISDEMSGVPTLPDPDGADSASQVDSSTPLTTELIGDPQPNPDSEATLPPLPESPAIDVCAALLDAAADDVVGAATGAAVVSEPIGEEACRLTAGGVTAEVHYLPEGVVAAEWFVREGIEPVGEVGPDAVGVLSFAPPGSESGDGYTIGLVNRRQGAVVAVRGATDDRGLAVQLATVVLAIT